MGITCVSQQKAWRSTPVGIRVTIIFAEKVLKPSRNSKVISPFSSKKRLEGNMSLKAVLPASTRYTSGTRPRNTSAKPQSTSFLPCPTTALKTTSWKDSPKFSIPVTLPFHFQLVSYHADCSLILVLEACNLLTTMTAHTDWNTKVYPIMLILLQIFIAPLQCLQKYAS